MELLQKTGLLEDLSDKLLNQRVGTFVTIEKEGNLRGCIGTYLPTKDYRFGPIQKEELPLLSYTVYLLGRPELVRDISELNPKKYGILVKTIPVDFSQKQDVVFNGHFPHKSGLLLPDLAGIETPEEQISIACQKAGIDLTKEKVVIYRFTAEKYQ
jgi:AMMECR1 domain-containing protein